MSALFVRPKEVSLRDGARRMEEAAIHLTVERLPLVPVRQFVVMFPVQLHLWMARSKSLCAKVCEKLCAQLTAHLQSAAGIEKGISELVVFIQRLGSALNLNIHFHVIALDGVYEKKTFGRLKFYAAQAASVAHRIAFGPNAAQPVRRLKTQTSLWPSEQNFKSNGTACVSACGYSISHQWSSYARMRKLPSRHMNASGSKYSCAPVEEHSTANHLG